VRVIAARYQAGLPLWHPEDDSSMRLDHDDDAADCTGNCKGTGLMSKSGETEEQWMDMPNDSPEPLYSIGTRCPQRGAYTPHLDGPNRRPFNLTRKQLVAEMRYLQTKGYTCHRKRDPETGYDGSYDNDTEVLIERTDGMPWFDILMSWRRG
jgi:hypothetical protein